MKIFILTSVLLFKWTLAHNGDGDFERKNSDLSSTLAENEINRRRRVLIIISKLSPVKHVQQPVEGQIKAQRNVHCGRVGGLKERGC